MWTFKHHVWMIQQYILTLWHRISRNHIFTDSGVNLNVCTFMTEGSSVGWLATVAGKTIGSLHTATLVLAEWAVTTAVAWASWSDPWGDPRPFLQVQSDAVQLQRADTAQKPFLPGCCASCQKKPHITHKYTLLLAFILVCHTLTIILSLHDDLLTATYCHCRPCLPCRTL